MSQEITMDLCELTLAVEEIVRKAGVEVKRCYEEGQFETFTKNDESPVTSADYAANEIITASLKELTPHIPIVSEESDPKDIINRHSWSTYWLIDPLDGTQEFVAGSGDFSVVVALVHDHTPSIGVIYAPIHDRCYMATLGQGAFRRDSDGLTPIQISAGDESTIRVAVSLRQDKLLVKRRLSERFNYDTIAMGSATLKACLVAQGDADIYMRVGPTGEWDTGAAHCILHEAGGGIFDLAMNTLTYNKRDTLANPNFVVCGNLSLPWLEIIKNS